MASTKVVKQDSFTLGDSTFAVEKVAEFFEKFRAIGMEGRYHLPRSETVRQYVICGVFSHEEIESGDDANPEIENISEKLIQLDREEGDRKFTRRFICHGRVAVLLNNFGRHGEARLFDPDGKIVRELGITTEVEENYILERQDILETMKRRFEKRFGVSKQKFIVLFSHLIPCTIENHMCSRLVAEYAERNHANIIVSYDNLWRETKKRLALRNLTHNNIHVIEPKDRRQVVHKNVTEIQLRTRGVKRLESYCDDEPFVPDSIVDELSKVCVSKRQRVRESVDKTLKLPGSVRENKRKKRGGMERQNSKPDRTKYWDD